MGDFQLRTVGETLKYMPTLKKADIEKLELSAEIKSDLLGLFDEIGTKENELATLRAKAPKDTETVVSSVDFEKYKSATAELEKLKTELATKLDSTGEQGENLLTMFAGFFE